MIDLETFSAEASGFLASHLKRREHADTRWGAGSDRIELHGLERRSDAEVAAEVAAARSWQAQCFDAGYAWITGPLAYGGRELAAAYERRWRELEQEFAAPDRTSLNIGLGMLVPAILAHGSPELRAEVLPGLNRGDLVGCQLFSEPGAGSDLANIATTAVRHGDGWMIRGHKVWTSKAQFGDLGLCIARTGAGGPPQRGLTVFLVDMHAPGVEIRPLRQMNGRASFNEVFLDDVGVSAARRVGDVDDGWSVVRTTLTNERAGVGSGATAPGPRLLARILCLARHSGAASEPCVRQQLADIYTRVRLVDLTAQRVQAAGRAGRAAGPEGSIGKLAHAGNLQRMSAAVTSILGPRLAADTGEWGEYVWSDLVLGAPGVRVAGGTDEIQRNVIAERVLGLPREPEASA
ncbi:MAG: acyl-CoA dehydrogenase [Actinomycetia bacterium]|nr:acyl-CoA dehydrogenase [Actinomycetes bacterium]